MPNVSPYATLSERHDDFAEKFARRVRRGDTNEDIQFWVYDTYKVRVSHQTIRNWRYIHVLHEEP